MILKDIFAIRVELLRIAHRPGLGPHEVEAMARKFEDYVFSDDPRSKVRQVKDAKAGQTHKVPGTSGKTDDG